ncbi:hypothetical protein EVAR_42879_1 [Eumeta japonica]|uniref:Uncharacterized protein n=1 Tax=Eumeta variegata TaxID=151549 RepID=A0A4C1YGX1_EUMVA|nr:hypothetical protein EVAR_42879_1 [Eumeta japonica]
MDPNCTLPAGLVINKRLRQQSSGESFGIAATSSGVPQASVDRCILHRVRSDGTCECPRRVTCAMDDAWRELSRHRMSQETVTGRFPSLLPGWRRLAAAGWSKET